MSIKVKKAWDKMKNVLKNKRGQGLVEYALILVLIAVVVIVAVRSIGSTTNKIFTNVNTQMQ